MASNKISKLLSAVRIADWRLSFVPFIIGSVYLWACLFKLNFTPFRLLVFILSICTSFGFAALGYFINEFFDKEDDAKAGKINKLSLLSGWKQLLLFVLVLLVTFAPWIVLPTNRLSYILIGLELTCFLLYSLPYLRMKHNFFFAGILDAAYAYLIPGILSFHTFSLLQSSHSTFHEIPIFFSLIFIIGYRNILIHQINDVLGDIRAGTESLVQKLGVDKTERFIQLLLFLELCLLISFSSAMLASSIRYSILALALMIYLLFHRDQLFAILTQRQFLSLKKERHLLDAFYQIWFPLICLTFLIFQDLTWLILAPIHLFVLVKKDYLKSFLNSSWHEHIRPVLSYLLNYTIYLAFRLIGIDLKKENSSAKDYLQSKFKSK